MSILTQDEADAMQVLARNRRLLVIIVPRGVDEEDVKRLSEEINAELEALVERRRFDT